MIRNQHLRLWAALLAALALPVAAAVAGGAIEGYSQLRHPLALLGARQLGVSGTVFGLFGFLLPGLAGAWLGVLLRGLLPAAAGWSARIGAQLVLLAALAFAAQALFPLDLEGLDAGSSRLHAGAWLLWALAFPCGALLLATGLRGQAGWQRLVVGSVLAAALVVAGGFLGSGWLGAALSQRLAFAAWLGWGVLVALQPAPFSRAAA